MAAVRGLEDSSGPMSTSEYVRTHRVAGGLSVEDLAEKVGVSADWLTAFEDGERTGELTYALLLALVRATQPPRPAWWDDGHEHDLHLGERGRANRDPATDDYWDRLEGVRASNRSRRSGG
jgi:transcriptional regulator with XRE-family HTH domain